MRKKFVYLFSILLGILMLTACSALPSTGTASTQGQANSTNAMPGQSQSVEDKLAIGTLKLEGTEKAVTKEQAKSLLTLWKAVKALSSDDNTAPAEITALYKQIQGVMTEEQIKAIKDLNLSQTDIQGVMNQYGVSMGQGSPKQSSTQTSSRSSSSGGSGGMPGGPGGGGMPPDMGGGGMPGGGETNTQSTPAAGISGRAQGRMNTMFVEALIKLLEQRANS